MKHVIYTSNFSVKVSAGDGLDQEFQTTFLQPGKDFEGGKIEELFGR